jgi:ESCRT-I complex subunit VPS28
MSVSQSTNNDDSDEEFEVPLYQNGREREELDEQANLFSIIMATEHLERAFARDAIDPKDYTEQCKKLISQFRLAERVLPDSMTTETFMALYQMNCPRATERLLRMGVPEPLKSSSGNANHAAIVAETVQIFITVMDAMQIKKREVFELHPLLSDLMDALTRLPDTPSDFEANRKVRSWLQKLNEMRAVDVIGDDDALQLEHDLNSAYAEFNRYLKQGN